MKKLLIKHLDKLTTVFIVLVFATGIRVLSGMGQSSLGENVGKWDLIILVPSAIALYFCLRHMRRYGLMTREEFLAKVSDEPWKVSDAVELMNKYREQLSAVSAAQPASDAQSPGDPTDPLDDPTYIRAIRQGASGPWQQYDVLLATQPYGWETMVDWAAYLNGADLTHVSTVTVSHLGGAGEKELADSYRESGQDLRKMPELSAEQSTLAIGGAGQALKDMVKIVWFNQTNRLRLFTTQDHGPRMERYVETLVRRTFSTPDAMKLATPPNENESASKED